jgi:hypothetical protein
MLERFDRCESRRLGSAGVGSASTPSFGRGWYWRESIDRLRESDDARWTGDAKGEEDEAADVGNAPGGEASASSAS